MPLDELKVARTFAPGEHELLEQTRKVIWPVFCVSGSLKVARSVGVAVASEAPSAGETSAGTSGATLAVLFVTAEPLRFAALLCGAATSRTRFDPAL